MRTFVATPKDINRKWFLVDAEGIVLGRLAVHIAKILSGRTKEEFTPHLDNGDGVIVINASKIKVTGKKLKDKIYTRYSGYPSGLKRFTLEELLMSKPEEVITRAVKGMLPHNKLGRHMIKRLRVYPDANYNQQAQRPIKLGLK
ncbi:MAG: 50S ribosomal protein L13 [Candidatus Omnitrophica bacterium]|nr:50S ribosomal protein L13 [Candidatus Omnitrophota bacterium]